jgi:hypothetical protein
MLAHSSATRSSRLSSIAHQKPVLAKPWYLRYRAPPYDDIGKYEDGTLFPIYLGDKLDSDRYIIWDKLGSGSDSHIWLAKDQQTRRVLTSCAIIVMLIPHLVPSLL